MSNMFGNTLIDGVQILSYSSDTTEVQIMNKYTGDKMMSRYDDEQS